jgi:SOS-response transcriptional repressor LexA
MKGGQPAKAGTVGFRGVTEDVWTFHLGGYQICEKWLKDRKGRTLSTDEIAHYQKIVVALSETIRLMQEIDRVIEAYGGWPGAFQTGETTPAGATVISFRPRIVQPSSADRYAACVPFVPLEIAAGAFGDPQHVQEDDFDWVALESAHRLRPGMFVAQVVGKSMEPAIPDGSYCLFSAPVTGSRVGKTVLVQLRDGVDPETGERYTVKRYDSQKDWEMEGLWQHQTITLRPNNPDFQPIVLTSAQEGDVKVIAELVEVLHGDA